MKLHTSLVALCLFILAPIPASAQTLTTLQQGRAAVGQCYATCATRAYLAADRLELSDERDREALWYGLLTRQEYRGLHCEGVQKVLIEIDVCTASCRDLEAAYGPVQSEAERILLHELADAKNEIRAIGLYTDYINHPDEDTPEFEAACNRLYSGG